jgi:hypothetical protein
MAASAERYRMNTIAALTFHLAPQEQKTDYGNYRMAAKLSRVQTYRSASL